MGSAAMVISTTSLRRNLKRTEWGAGILAVSLLVILFLTRLSGIGLAAEQTLLVTRVQDMQAELATMHLEFVTGARDGRGLSVDAVVAQLDRGDIRRVQTAPEIQWREVPAGTWVFVRDLNRLEYRVASQGDFVDAVGSPPRVRFQLRPLYADTDGQDSAPRRLTAVRLQRLRAED